ncbi:hypothetical protein NA8A_18257 [Nitratireductor indicus C115]|uniref:Uncharacterized protein n=1 Tax=Nitratireductor indicus C115 TaxID=1231190 RepID=K2P0J6_9HYPH|nr:hypothetical protein [Nitratireductor indicus]EKF40861.1 hypothetical protein NA8A_18257 [Nitratireductor indicus C115]SFQ33580.1 hypothetical protein SAMN05216176_102642 [Nitratireductor indicus]
MAAPEIDEKFLAAGREYGDALIALGLDPHALFWAFDKTEKRHVLVLVTDFFDYTGPLEISKQLLRAYNASITPKEIDPFVVRLHSIHQSISERYVGAALSDGTFHVWDKNMNPKHVPPGARVEYFDIGDLTLKPEWTIKARSLQTRNSVEIGRKWKRFVRNVDKIAA